MQRDPRQVRQELDEFRRVTAANAADYGCAAGDRVELVHSSDGHTALRPGDRGTVTYTRHDGVGRVVGVNWDSGSGLSMLLDEGDAIRKVDA